MSSLLNISYALSHSYSKFADAFAEHGYDDPSDLAFDVLPATELTELVRAAGGKQLQIARIGAAFVVSFGEFFSPPSATTMLLQALTLTFSNGAPTFILEAAVSGTRFATIFCTAFCTKVTASLDAVLLSSLSRFLSFEVTHTRSFLF